MDLKSRRPCCAAGMETLAAFSSLNFSHPDLTGGGNKLDPTKCLIHPTKRTRLSLCRAAAAQLATGASSSPRGVGRICFPNSFVTIALLALVAVLTHNPFVFPSLGPTAYLFFFSPLAEASAPRNAIFGHAIGL